MTVKDTKIGSRDLKGISRESIAPPSTTDKSFYPEKIYSYGIYNLEFKEICLKQNSVYFLYKNIINLYIIYKIDTCSKYLSTEFALDNCLCGAVKLTKNSDSDKYKYSGYSIGFDSRSRFS